MPARVFHIMTKAVFDGVVIADSDVVPNLRRLSSTVGLVWLGAAAERRQVPDARHHERHEVVDADT